MKFQLDLNLNLEQQAIDLLDEMEKLAEIAKSSMEPESLCQARQIDGGLELEINDFKNPVFIRVKATHVYKDYDWKISRIVVEIEGEQDDVASLNAIYHSLVQVLGHPNDTFFDQDSNLRNHNKVLGKVLKHETENSALHPLDFGRPMTHEDWVANSEKAA